MECLTHKARYEAGGIKADEQKQKKKACRSI